jgi:excisionase family DNA binding protein
LWYSIEALMTMVKTVFRVEEAAEYLSISRAKAYELIQRGELRSVKIDGSRRITLNQLEEYIHRLEAAS